MDISICCTTYNHEKYIAQTIESIISQKGKFTYELLIHDDNSTDNTKKIIEEYAKKYPQIKPIYQTENKYSTGIPINETYNFPRAQGKYIALCEGDDFWIDENKLYMQYEYMENNDGCTFCFTNAIVKDESKRNADKTFIPFYENEAYIYAKESKKYNLSEILDLTFIPTASFMFRSKDYFDNINIFKTPFPYGDLRFKTIFTNIGYAKLIDVNTCVYRLNVENSALSIWKKENRKKSLDRYLSLIDYMKQLNTISKNKYSPKIDEHIIRYSSYALEYIYDIKQLKNPYLFRAFKQKNMLQQIKIIAKAIIK